MLRAGFSEVDITPLDSASVAGYYYPRRSTGVHDPLMGKTMALAACGGTLVVASCDAIRIPTDLADRFRKEVSRRTGISQAGVSLCATHSHTAPELTDAYCEELLRRLLESSAEALQRLQPVTLSYGRFDEPALVHCRRYWMKDGTVRTNPGKQNPEVLCPAGAVDPEVQVLEMRDAAGQSVAIWVGVALHLDTVGGTLFSADFPHFMGQALKAKLGKGLFTFFTSGAAGNINHWRLDDSDPQRSLDEARRIGETLARGVLRARTTSSPAPVEAVGAELEGIALDPFPASDTEYGWATRQAGKELREGVDFTLELVHAMRLEEIDRVYHRRPLRCPIQSFALGRAVAVTMIPGEPFAELGLTIKDHSPFPMTVVAGLANGYLSYFPTRTAYRQGAYEPTAARVAPGEGERLVQASLAQLRRLFERPPGPNGGDTGLRILEKGTA